MNTNHPNSETLHPNPKVAALILAARARHAERQEQIAARRLAELQVAMDIDGNTTIEEQLADDPAPVTLHLLPAAQAAARKNLTASRLDFNERQQEAIELALQGKSFCLIGAAGTGKTTVTQEIISLLQQSSHVLPMAEATKHLVKDNPGIVICGFTNKAVNNIRKKLPAHLQRHCITIHKLLEYAPVYYEVPGGEDGSMVTTMRFEPMRNGANPLPHISTLIFEESSMIGTELYGEVIAALARRQQTQIIFLGDLNQIPPVFGPSILGFKLGELSTIELTHVYRQALLSPIITLATDIRLNKQEALPLLTSLTKIDNGEHGVLHLHPWKKRVSNGSAVSFMRSFLPKMIEEGTYDPNADMILCPFNKSFGTIELNKIIANHIAKQAKETVFEVIARYVKSYWAVGDRVLVDRHEAIITKIERTIGYGGKLPRTESATLDRWGFDPENDTPSSLLTADEILNQLDTLGEEGEGSKNLASHTITVIIPDTDEVRRLSTAGEINSMIFGYVLTVHKSQGSEWQKVFLFLHNSHASLLSRELLYTAVTRAKHELYIICEGDIKPYENTLRRAAARPVIPGTSLAEKIEFFRSKATSMKQLAED